MTDKTPTTPSAQPAAKSALMRLAKPVITLACLAIVATVLWQLLPKQSFSSDLSQLGQGLPGLVLMREVQVMGGERVLEQMQILHREFDERMVFLLVHTGNPSGQQFAATHGVRDGDVVLFDAQGRALGTISQPATPSALRQFIYDTLPSNGDQHGH